MKKIPGISGHWFWGSRGDFAAAPHTFPAELGWRYGGLAQFRVVHKRLLAVTDPLLARHILVGRHENYVRSVQYRNFAQIAGRGLLTMDGEPWRLRRRQVQPAFHAARLLQVAATAGEACGRVLDEWLTPARAGEVVDAAAAMQRVVMEVITRLLFGDGIGAEAAQAYAGYTRATRTLMRERNTALLALPVWWPTQNRRRSEAFRDRIDAFVSQRIACARQTISATDMPRNEAMLAILESARDPETGLGLSRQEILAEAKILITAGFETTAIALSWTLYLLARHPECAAQWHDEVDRVLGGRTPAYEDIARLPYTAQVIQEAMRLYPPIYSVGREAVAEDELGGHVIPRGQTILISVYGIHRSPELWAAPEAFRPQRFAAEGEEATRHAYFPFALGKHTCIGNHFAMTEMAIVLAMIGQRYRLALPEGFTARISAQITLDSAGPIPLLLTPRA
jgi:cytochrome P450